MHRISLKVILLLCVATLAPAATMVTSNGITWNFGGDYTVGQYCTGDWWVVDPNPGTAAGVVITSSTHAAAAGAQAGEVHSVNPKWGSQGYDTRSAAYQASQAATLPVTLQAGDCIVTATKLVTFAHTGLYSGAILTVVDVPQATDSFRPPYTRMSRVAASAGDPLLFSLSDISASKWALLPRLPRSGVPSLPALSSTAGKVRGPWIDHLGSAYMGEIHPTQNQPWYGADVSQCMSEAAAQLCLDYGLTDLQSLAKYVIQIGIDYYAMLDCGGEWHPDGGHGSGRKFPIVFASVMLDNAAMKGFPRMYSTTHYRFGEDGQTYYYDDAVGLAAYQGPPPSYPVYSGPGTGRVQVQGVKGWIDKLSGGAGDVALWRITNDSDVANCTAHEHLNIADWSPDENHQAKSEAYRIANTSPQWIGQAMMMMLFGNDTGASRNEMINIWNHDAYFSYCLRWMSQDYTAANNLFYAKYGVRIGGQQTSNLVFVNTMWNTYKNLFPQFRTATSHGTIPLPSRLRISAGG